MLDFPGRHLPHNTIALCMYPKAFNKTRQILMTLNFCPAPCHLQCCSSCRMPPTQGEDLGHPLTDLLPLPPAQSTSNISALTWLPESPPA